MPRSGRAAHVLSSVPHFAAHAHAHARLEVQPLAQPVRDVRVAARALAHVRVGGGGGGGLAGGVWRRGRPPLGAGRGGRRLAADDGDHGLGVLADAAEAPDVAWKRRIFFFKDALRFEPANTRSV